MKKIIYFFSALVLVSFFFVACTKQPFEDEKSENSIKSLATKSMLSKLDNCEHLDFKEVNIGDVHNQSVITIFNNVDFGDSDNLEANVTTQFENLTYDPSPLGLTNEEFFDKVEARNESLRSYDYDLRNWANNGLSDEVNGLITKILNECDNITELAAFNRRMDELQADANETLTCDELDNVTGTIIIAKSSAYLWAPKDLGGYDLLGFTSGKHSKLSSQAKLSWWQRAVVGDVSASSQYFLGIGIAGAAGLGVPGANAAILGGWGISAGLGSAFAAIGL